MWAYEKGFKKVFCSRYKERRVEFVRRTGIKARETNNVVERLHGTLKDRLKHLRGLKSEETAKIWLDGWFVYYKFLRLHLIDKVCFQWSEDGNSIIFYFSSCQQ